MGTQAGCTMNESGEAGDLPAAYLEGYSVE
jgi:hypothetical protein